MPSRLFKQRQHIRHTEQFPNLFAGVHHFQPASPRPRGNMQSHHCPQPRTVHHWHFLQVQNNPPLLPASLQHLHLQKRHILARQSPKAFHHPTILHLPPLHPKSPRRTNSINPRHRSPPSSSTLRQPCPLCTSFPPLCLATSSPRSCRGGARVALFGFLASGSGDLQVAQNSCGTAISGCAPGEHQLR